MKIKRKSKGFEALFARAEELPEYWSAGPEIEFTEELCRVMEEKGVSRAELARRVGSSAAYITKILRGNTNFTLATMAKFCRALGMDMRLHLAPRGSRTVWKDTLSAPESWPERQSIARQSLEAALISEGRGSEAPGIPAAKSKAISTTMSSTTLEMKGEIAHESSADQVA